VQTKARNSKRTFQTQCHNSAINNDSSSKRRKKGAQQSPPPASVAIMEEATAEEFLSLGLRMMGRQEGGSAFISDRRFRGCFGPTPEIVAQAWNLLDPEATMPIGASKLKSFFRGLTLLVVIKAIYAVDCCFLPPASSAVPHFTGPFYLMEATVPLNLCDSTLKHRWCHFRICFFEKLFSALGTGTSTVTCRRLCRGHLAACEAVLQLV
jgi:hypothetical protein